MGPHFFWYKAWTFWTSGNNVNISYIARLWSYRFSYKWTWTTLLFLIILWLKHTILYYSTHPLQFTNKAIAFLKSFYEIVIIGGMLHKRVPIDYNNISTMSHILKFKAQDRTILYLTSFSPLVNYSCCCMFRYLILT